jgi:hypothetical protein
MKSTGGVDQEEGLLGGGGEKKRGKVGEKVRR